MQVQPARFAREDSPAMQVHPNVLSNYRHLYTRYAAAPYTGDDAELTNHVNNVSSLPTSEQTDLCVVYEMRLSEIIRNDKMLTELRQKIEDADKRT